jgi:hypothetical protein
MENPEQQAPRSLRESKPPPRTTLAGAVTCATWWQDFPEREKPALERKNQPQWKAGLLVMEPCFVVFLFIP